MSRHLETLPKKWQDSADCLVRQDIDFFPDKSSQSEIRAAKEVCKNCPVRAECLLYAYKAGEDYGIWGGTDNARDRERFFSLLQISPAPTNWEQDLFKTKIAMRPKLSLSVTFRKRSSLSLRFQ